MGRFILATYKRQTGRTYRMMENAIKLASAGKRVHIVMSSQGRFREFQRILTIAHANLNIKVPLNALNIHIESPNSLTIDVKDNRVVGDRDAELLVDHSYFETHYGFAIKGFHEYDSET